jgi:cytoskeleton protein RodZ
MSVVVQIPDVSACTERRERRLHLRDVSDAPGPEAQVQSVGQLLRTRREALGLDEKAVAVRLCLRKDLVTAIEAGQHERLPARVYALGYVRSYALLLGLDPASVVNRFKAEFGGFAGDRAAAPAFPDVEPTGRLARFRLFGAAALGGGLIYLLIQVLASSSPALPVANVDEDGPVTVVEAASIFQASEPATTVEATSPVAAAPAPPLAIVAPVPTLSRITLRATETSYLEVRDKAVGPVHPRLIARELKAGESFAVPDRKGLVLLAGNAGGLQVEVDGRSVGVLGERGQVARLDVDPAYFLSRPGTSR